MNILVASSQKFFRYGLLACVLAAGSLAQAASINKEQASEIVAALQASSPASFADFMQAVEGMSIAQSSQVAALQRRYARGEALSAEQQDLMFRLLGLYARVKYEDAALQTLTELVAIPTFDVEGLPQYENPEFLRFGTKLESVAQGLGLQFRNVGNRIYEISLGPDQGELIGIHAHADVVPVNPDLWVLEDGTKLDPFVVTRIGDRLYGRGTEDDKNGIVVTMYAMHVVQEENLPLLRHFKLLVDTREETGGDAMPYYFERNPVPDYNIAMDGSYPVTIAEKGYGTVMATFPVRAPSGEGAEIVELTGGLATNQIPASTTVWLRSSRPEALVRTLNEEGAVFAARNGSNFAIRAEQSGGRVRLDILGVPAHSSEPQTGVNPVSRMFAFLTQLAEEGLVQQNHFTDAARYATENWGLDFLGSQLGIGYEDAFMGPLTAAQTFVALDDTRLRTAVNLRLPIGRVPAELVTQLEQTLTQWAEENEVDVSLAISASEPMYRNPEGHWVNTMLDIAVENLDMPREFGSSAGGTSIHDLPNGVQFGLAMPDEKYTGHNANEFKRLEQFLLDLQITTELLARLGTMSSL
ncbi:MAG: dipeptidase [Pseudomonadales bacterium]|nr:dipeptidase [Pseudomonadales bacterium]MCP5357606.1 dipeptidase [Pseudomonadales bacterium]